MVRAKGISAFGAALAISGAVCGVTAAPGDSATAKDAQVAVHASAFRGFTGAGTRVRAVFSAYDSQPTGGSRGGGGQGNGGGGGQGNAGGGGQGNPSSSASPSDQGSGPSPQTGGGQGSQGSQGDPGATRGSGSNGSGSAGSVGSSGAGGNPTGGDSGRGGSPSGGAVGGGTGGSTGNSGQGTSGSGTVQPGNSAAASGGGATSSGSSSSSGQGRCTTSCNTPEQAPPGVASFTPTSGNASTGLTSTSSAPTSSTTPGSATTTTPKKTTQPASSPKKITSTSTIGSPRRRSGTHHSAGPATRAGATAGGRRSVAPASAAPLAALLGSVPISSPKTAGISFHRTTKGTTTVITTPGPNSTTVIQKLERFVPVQIWIALGLALVLAALASASALWARRRVRKQARQFAVMSTAAMTDPLTGVLNRRGFSEAVERELVRAQRYGRPFVLAYVDVRGLKAVNDSEGHRAGDKLIREAALLLQDSARANDVVGRLGGDEMGLLLVEQTSAGAAAVQRRIETQVLERRASMGLHTYWDLTIGTAAFPEDGETFDELLRAADRRLYAQRGIVIR
jgi:diguanylate cyclase (GGDEF)-like protein